MKLEFEDEDGIPDEELKIVIWDEDWGRDDQVGEGLIKFADLFSEDGTYQEKDFDLTHQDEFAGTVTLGCWKGLKRDQRAEDEEVDEEKEARKKERAEARGENGDDTDEDDSDPEYDEQRTAALA